MRKIKVRYTRNGKVTEMAPAFATVLEGVGLVEPYDDTEAPVKKKRGRPKKTTEQLPSGKYKRRDLKAED